MDQDIYYMQEQLSAVWPEWRVVRRLGRGSYGAVYEIMRDDLGSVYKCALKVLQMSASVDDYHSFEPVSERTSEVAAGFAGTRPVFETGGDHYGGYESRDETIEDFVHSVSSEIDVMIRLKGTPGVVSIEDYTVLRSAAGCMILIRMEELEGLEAYIRRTGILSPDQVVRLGIDLCTALDFCEQSGILHRDIKPGNIFYSDRAGFKLGDFGISKRMESIYEKRAMSRVGTVQYMAPETFFGDAYGNTADLYSLGLVLYTLLNGNMPPFCEQDLVSDRAGSAGNGGSSGNMGSMQVTHSANIRRLKGEELPSPSLAGERLAAVVCMACDPIPEKRYQSAREFRKALQECMLPGKAGLAGSGRRNSGTGKNNAGKPDQGGISRGELPYPAVIGVTIACAAVILFLLFARGNGNDAGNSGARETPNTKAETARENALSSKTVSYTVLSKDLDGYTLEKQVKTGNVGEQVTESSPQIEGYSSTNSAETLLLSEIAEDNVIIFLYEKNKDENTTVTYIVLCIDGKTGEQLKKNTYYGNLGDTIRFHAPGIDGYTAKNNDMSIILSEDEAQNILNFVYENDSNQMDIPSNNTLYYNGHHYYIFDEDGTNWNDARENCQKLGGYLAVINDVNENNALFQFMEDNNLETAFFGLIFIDGNWDYLDGDTSDFRNWGINYKNVEQPNNYEEGDIHVALDVHMKVSGTWNDVRYGRTDAYVANGSKYKNLHTYICEWDK